MGPRDDRYSRTGRRQRGEDFSRRLGRLEDQAGPTAARLRDFSPTDVGHTHTIGRGAGGHAFQAPASSRIVDILFEGAVRLVCISVPVAKTAPEQRFRRERLECVRAACAIRRIGVYSLCQPVAKNDPFLRRGNRGRRMVNDGTRSAYSGHRYRLVTVAHGCFGGEQRGPIREGNDAA